MSLTELPKQNIKLRGKVIEKHQSKNNSLCYLVIEYITQNPSYTNRAKVTIKEKDRELCYDAFELDELVEVYFNIETKINDDGSPGIVNLYAWKVISLI